MNRARIREIAEEATDNIDLDVGAHFGAKGIIESAILRFAEELLTQEPSVSALKAGVKAFQHAKYREEDRLADWRECYRAMSTQLLKELKA